MLSEICAELRNYFAVPGGIHRGTFEIKDGMAAPLDFLQEGQYFRVVGSVFNDGVHQYPAADLTDETFSGAVWALAIPADFLAIVSEIEEYAKSDAAKANPYILESFGGYTYQKASDKGGSNSWQSVFSKRLNRYRRISL